MGVVGGNFGATFHWHEHPNCKITGVTDLIPELRENLKKYYQCDQVYGSLEEMIQKSRDIDVVAVFSGGNRHAQHAKMCMENGWHVIVACPACFTLEEAALLKEVKERTGMKYIIGGRNPFLRGIYIEKAPLANWSIPNVNIIMILTGKV